MKVKIPRHQRGGGNPGCTVRRRFIFDSFIFYGGAILLSLNGDENRKRRNNHSSDGHWTERQKL